MQPLALPVKDMGCDKGLRTGCNGVAPSWGRCACRRGEDGKLRVTLVFSVGELLYDIANMAWVEGDLMDGADYDHIRHLVQDIAEDGNRDRVMRVMGLAHAEADALLDPWSRREIAGGVYLDDEPEGEDEYVTRLEVPAGTGRATITLLLRLIHEWIVCRVLQDWLSVTYPGSAEAWAAKVEDLREAIRDAKSIGRKITRRRLSPWP